MTSRALRPVAVAPARSADAGRIVELVRDAFAPGVVSATIYGSHSVDAWVRDKVGSSASTRDRAFVCAWETERIVGCIDLALSQPGLLVNYIAVDPSYRGRGVGTAMLRWVLQEEGNSDAEIILDVLADNSVARAWYGRLGFVASSASVWCDGSEYLQPTALAERYSLAERGATQLIYGFSECDISVGSSSYRIGRLGDRWWRLCAGGPTQEPSGCRDLLGALHELEPSRDLLVIAQDGWADAPTLARLIRLSAPIADVLERLEG